MKYTFRGGIRPDARKSTTSLRAEAIAPPDEVVIPLAANASDVCQALVRVGDKVLAAQKIGRCDHPYIPVYSSVSGTVKDIRTVLMPSGDEVRAVVIENGKDDAFAHELSPIAKKLSECSADEICDRVREAGIVDSDGLPVYEKLQAFASAAELLIINCTEPEPYITSRRKLILEKSEAIANGAKIIMKALGIRRTYFAIDDGMLDAANVLEKIAANSRLFEVKLLRAKYPQSEWHVLVSALTGKSPAKLSSPLDAGAALFSAETCADIYNALAVGIPPIKKYVTVDGDAAEKPMTLVVPMGTTVSALAEYCKVDRSKPHKTIVGDPISGIETNSADTPVTQSVGGVLFFTGDTLSGAPEASPCINCGRCLRVCPMQLAPCFFVRDILSNVGVSASDIDHCIECASCSYVCPAKIDIAGLIRREKAAIRESGEKDI